MTVYRVQDKDGRGPFKPGFSSKWVVDRPDHENLPPWFYEFGMVNERMTRGRNGGSACTSLEKLRRWFTKREYETLKEYGYQAYEMKVDRILAESNVQVFFERRKPLNVGNTPIKLH